jgi:uncharacterized protein (DUF4415 family)
MARKTTEAAASRPDEDNPEWTAADFASARPAAEVLPLYIGQAATAELMGRRPGRPKSETRKINQTLRLDSDVVEAYRKKGKGWQILINKILRQNMPASEC